MQSYVILFRYFLFILVVVGFILMMQANLHGGMSQPHIPTPTVAILLPIIIHDSTPTSTSSPTVTLTPTPIPTLAPTPTLILTPTVLNCAHEPNDQWQDSIGPLFPLQYCNGSHDDDKDFFYFDSQQWGEIVVELQTPFQDGVQLQLFQTYITNRIGFVSSAPYRINGWGSATRYYIYVFTSPEKVGTETYDLNISYTTSSTVVSTNVVR